MPTYYRPRVAHIDPGGADVGGLLALAAAAVAIGAVVLFVFAHLLLLAVCAAVFVTAIGGFAVWTRRFATLPNRRPANPRPVPVKITQGAGQAQQAIRGNGGAMITGRRRILRLEPPETITAGLDLPSRPEAAPASPAEAIARSLQPTSPPVPSPSPGSPAAAP